MRSIQRLFGRRVINATFLLTVPLWVAALASVPVRAHCDTLDGPVVVAARAALEARDVTPVLRWVAPEQETEIRAAFAKSIVVRAGGPEARELADRFFFETLVRVHRSGEGAPYEGLKPAGSPVSPAVKSADTALSTGEVGGLVKLVTGGVEAGIRERWARVIETKRHADESVTAGRAYVSAYVDFVHYAERLHETSSGPVQHGDGDRTAGSHAGH